MNSRILVIADDFTGAAEIAGIGSRYGLNVELLRQPHFDSTANMLVIDTDSRSLSPEKAAGRVSEVLAKVTVSEFNLIFKKIDSILRGPVLAEVEAAMRSLNKTTAIIAPANPSRGRTIFAGEYRIDGIPLHRTALANDPEHPLRSSKVEELIGQVPSGVTIADATTEADVARWATTVDAQTLPVGAADFFAAILSNRGFTPGMHNGALGPGRMLLVCGTTSESSRLAISNMFRRGVRVLAPDDNPALNWGGGHAIVTSGEPCSTSERESVLPRLARFVASRLETVRVDEILIEGGATSAAILKAMCWNRFRDCVELVPGVVRISVVGGDMHITVKPGSYPWPDDVWTRLSADVPPRTK